MFFESKQACYPSSIGLSDCSRAARGSCMSQVSTLDLDSTERKTSMVVSPYPVSHSPTTVQQEASSGGGAAIFFQLSMASRQWGKHELQLQFPLHPISVTKISFVSNSPCTKIRTCIHVYIHWFGQVSTHYPCVHESRHSNRESDLNDISVDCASRIYIIYRNTDMWQKQACRTKAACRILNP